MPALIPVDNTLGALLIGTVLSSIIYGITWLQVYSYYNSHSSRDRWPLKFFVAFLMLVDSVNVCFVSYATYYVSVTNFGDYLALELLPWSLPAVALSAIVLEVSVQHFYAIRIYRLSRGSPYLPAAISAISLTAFGFGIVFGTKVLEAIHSPGNPSQGFFLALVSCNVLCDALITFGMVYTLLGNRTQVRRTNNVLNLLAIYAINCGVLTLVFSIASIILLAMYRNALIYTPSSFIMIRLYFCAFMAILNSRDDLRETLDGPESVVTTFTQLKARSGTPVPGGVQVTTETSTSTTVRGGLPPVKFSSETSFSDGVMAFEGGKHPVPPLHGVLPV
jgi:hypothetical protein